MTVTALVLPLWLSVSLGYMHGVVHTGLEDCTYVHRCSMCVFWGFFCITCRRSEHMDTCKSSFAQLTWPLHSLLCVYRVSTLFSSIQSLTPQHTRHIFATWSADFANFHPPTLWLIFILNLIWSKPVSCVDSPLLTFVRASLWHYFLTRHSDFLESPRVA